MSKIENKPKCPMCGSENLAVERRPDGNAKCIQCKFEGSYENFFLPSYDKLLEVIKIVRQGLDLIGDVTSAMKNASNRTCSYNDFELRLIARETIAKADEGMGK